MLNQAQKGKAVPLCSDYTHKFVSLLFYSAQK